MYGTAQLRDFGSVHVLPLALYFVIDIAVIPEKGIARIFHGIHRFAEGIKIFLVTA